MLRRARLSPVRNVCTARPRRGGTASTVQLQISRGHREKSISFFVSPFPAHPLDATPPPSQCLSLPISNSGRHGNSSSQPRCRYSPCDLPFQLYPPPLEAPAPSSARNSFHSRENAARQFSYNFPRFARLLYLLYMYIFVLVYSVSAHVTAVTSDFNFCNNERKTNAADFAELFRFFLNCFFCLANKIARMKKKKKK